MNTIPISEAKRVLENNEMTRVVIFATSADGMQYVATFGKTAQNAQEAAKAGNRLKESLGWDQEPAVPLKRICENCDFYKPDYGMHCFNGWSGDGSSGDCMVAPKRSSRNASDRACALWEPKS